MDFSSRIHVDDDLLVNVNRIAREEAEKAQEEGVDLIVGSLLRFVSIVITFVASGIEEAIGSLSVAGEADRHPEKRMKALYTAYEEEWMARLKSEYPDLKRSQLKERIFKQWQKAPENPLRLK